MKIIKEKTSGFDSDTKNLIIKAFQNLHFCNKEANYKEYSNIFMEFMKLKNESFHKYLLKEWMNEKYEELWSCCYFPIDQLNVNVTNNHLESLHKVIKYYLSNRNKMRLDELLKFLFTTVSKYYCQIFQNPNMGKFNSLINHNIERGESILKQTNAIISSDDFKAKG